MKKLLAVILSLILILTFATALKNMTGELGAAYYVGDLMNGAASTLQKFLPAIVFIVACILAFVSCYL